MGLSEFVSPVSTSNGNDRKFGQDNGTTDGSGDFFGTFHSESDVTSSITDSDDSLEASTLTGTGLFLDRLNFQNFVLERGSDEMIDDLEFLDSEREVVDLLNGLDFSVFNETSEFSDGLPLLGLGLSAATSTTASTASTATTKTSTETSAGSTLGWSSVRHVRS